MNLFSANEMQDNHDQSDHEKEMNKASRDVGEESDYPEYD
jgi:hypothetical protein